MLRKSRKKKCNNHTVNIKNIFFNIRASEYHVSRYFYTYLKIRINFPSKHNDAIIRFLLNFFFKYIGK